MSSEKGKNISYDEAAGWLDARDNFLVLTHIRPDGDTLGSAGGLSQALRELGKTVYILPNPEATPRYSKYAEDYYAPNGWKPEFIIALDTATVDLIPANASKYLSNISLCIDHHGTNTGYADLVCCFPDVAACGEIIFDILGIMLKKKDMKISKVTADCLYVAIATDTGCFCYRNTTADTHSIAAQLIEHGASNAELNKLLFRTKRRERIEIEGMVYSAIEFLYGGKVAIVAITREMMNTSGAMEDDIDDISNLPSSVEGVGIGITIREMSSPADCKISVRATPPYDASELCRRFGGGGHKAAAGATFKKNIPDVKKDLLAVLDEYNLNLNT